MTDINYQLLSSAVFVVFPIDFKNCWKLIEANFWRLIDWEIFRQYLLWNIYFCRAKMGSRMLSSFWWICRHLSHVSRV